MTLDQFDGVLKRAGRPRGHEFLRGLLDAYRGGDVPTESELESRIYEMVVGSGLCDLVKQAVHWIRGRRCRIDFMVPDTDCRIEALGYRWHGLWDVWQRDLSRINRLIAQGFRPLQWTWDAITERPGECISDLKEMLGARGEPSGPARSTD